MKPRFIATLTILLCLSLGHDSECAQKDLRSVAKHFIASGSAQNIVQVQAARTRFATSHLTDRYTSALIQALSFKPSIEATSETIRCRKGRELKIVHDPLVSDFNCQTHALIFIDLRKKSGGNFESLDDQAKSYLILSQIMTYIRQNSRTISPTDLEHKFGVKAKVSPKIFLALVKLFLSEYAVLYLKEEVLNLPLLSEKQKQALLKVLNPTYISYKPNKVSGIKVVNLYPSAYICLLLARSKGIPVVVEVNRFIDDGSKVSLAEKTYLNYQPGDNRFKSPVVIKSPSLLDEATYLFKVYSIKRTVGNPYPVDAYETLLRAKTQDEFIGELAKHNLMQLILSTAVNADQHGPLGGGPATKIPAENDSPLLSDFNKIIHFARRNNIFSPHSFKCESPNSQGVSIPFNVEHVFVAW